MQLIEPIVEEAGEIEGDAGAVALDRDTQLAIADLAKLGGCERAVARLRELRAESSS